MSKLLDFAKEVTYYNSYISIIDNDKVVVDNCKSIIECSDIMVKVLTREYDVEIWGNGLTVTNYTNTSIEINGCISNVSLEKRRGSI